MHPETKMILIQTYCLSFYSSQLWDLYGKEANKLYNQWNVLVRAMWDVPRETHRNLIEPLSETTHIKNILLTRFVSFTKTLLTHGKESVRFLANKSMFNTETSSGKTLRRLKIETKGDVLSLSQAILKEKLPPFKELEPEDYWKPNLIKELVIVMKGYGTISLENGESLLTYEELQGILKELCCQ